PAGSPAEDHPPHLPFESHARLVKPDAQPVRHAHRHDEAPFWHSARSAATAGRRRPTARRSTSLFRQTEREGGAPVLKIEPNLFGGFDLRQSDGKLVRCEKKASGETECRVVQEGRRK